MNNKISNPKTEVPETKELNNKDYIETLLLTEKSMVKNLAVAITEASCDELYNNYYDMLSEISELQREIYVLMFKKGWYQLEMADNTKIDEKLNTLTQELTQL